MTTYKLDIFETLNHINGNDFEFYSVLDEEKQKAFAPVVAMKWMLGTNNGKQIQRLNDNVNKYVFALGKHKGLLFQLLCTVTNGKSVRYKYIKTATKSSGSKPISVDVIKEYYGYSTKDAIQFLPCFSKEDVLEMAEYLGRQADEITKIKNEHKGTTKTKAKAGV